jgi:FtsH-binding integral membrane protein
MMSKLYQYLTISLFCTVIGFFVGWLLIPASIIAIANMLLLVVLTVMLVFAFIMKLVKKKKNGPIRFPIFFVYLFSFVEGALIYPALTYYMESLGMILFLEIVVGTMVIFGVLAFIGQKQKSGAFVGLGKILFVLLTVMVIVSLINLFLQIDALSMLISAAGIFVFSAYILVDVNQFKRACEAGYINDSSDYSIYVLNIYLDIINLLLDILDIINKIKN